MFAKPRRRLRFSMRQTMGCLVLASVLFSLVSWRLAAARHQKSVVDEIAAINGYVEYDFQLEDRPSIRKGLAEVVGNDLVGNVVTLSVPGPQDIPRLNQVLLRAKTLGSVRGIHLFWGIEVDDRCMATVVGNSHLQGSTL